MENMEGLNRMSDEANQFLESAAEIPTVKTEYDLSGAYGEGTTHETGESFDLSGIRPDARNFDGYFHTSEGEFAVQATVTEAQRAAKAIQKYCEFALVHKNLLKQLPDLEREEHRLYYQWHEGRIKDEPYLVAKRKHGALRISVDLAKRDLDRSAEAVKQYR